MDKMKFRNLKADEIEVFPKMVKEHGCLILLYKDARCDQNILDETVGPMKWQRHHSRDNANCIVSIWNDDIKQWIEKEDTGVESYTAKEKGLASDSFKRACFNWGIGRELYTTPFVWVSLDSNETSKYNNKIQLDRKVKFHVSHIKTVDKKIIELKLKDQNNKTRFTYKSDAPSKTPDKPKPKAKPLAQSKIKALYAKANEKGYTNDSVKSTIKKHYNADSTKDLTVEQFTEFMDKLDKAPPKEDKKR